MNRLDAINDTDAGHLILVLEACLFEHSHKTELRRADFRFDNKIHARFIAAALESQLINPVRATFDKQIRRRDRHNRSRISTIDRQAERLEQSRVQTLIRFQNLVANADFSLTARRV